MSRHSSELADNLRKEIMSIILSAWKDNTAFSFTSDMYRSKNLLLFMGLMVHFLDKDFNLRKFVLHADYFGERRHTAEIILMAVNTFMKEASLDGPDVTFIILLDNASNNKQAMSLGAGDYSSLWCAIHTLQLSIKEASKIKLGQVRVWKVVAQCKAVSALVRRSESNKDALKQACIRPDINLILPSKPGVTRWNAMEANIHSCLHLQPALSFYDRSHT